MDTLKNNFKRSEVEKVLTIKRNAQIWYVFVYSLLSIIIYLFFTENAKEDLFFAQKYLSEDFEFFIWIFQ